MLTTIAALLIQQESLPTASTVVSKMIARYHDAKTLKGDCTTTLKVGTREIRITATFQIERPTRMYLRQTVDGAPTPYIVTSDGKNFSYNKPVGVDDRRGDKLRLMEQMPPSMTLGDVYRAVSDSVVERSPVLDLAVGDMRDLQLFREQLTSLKLTGETDLNSEKVYRIVGKWRLNSKSEVTADFGLYITAEGDLKRYVLNQVVDIEGPPLERLTVSRLYDVDIKVNVDVDPKLFAVLK